MAARMRLKVNQSLKVKRTQYDVSKQNNQLSLSKTSVGKELLYSVDLVTEALGSVGGKKVKCITGRLWL